MVQKDELQNEVSDDWIQVATGLCDTRIADNGTHANDLQESREPKHVINDMLESFRGLLLRHVTNPTVENLVGSPHEKEMNELNLERERAILLEQQLSDLKKKTDSDHRVLVDELKEQKLQNMQLQTEAVEVQKNVAFNKLLQEKVLNQVREESQVSEQLEQKIKQLHDNEARFLQLETQHNVLRTEADALRALVETRAEELNNILSAQKIMVGDLTAAQEESLRLKKELCVASAQLHEGINELRQKEEHSLQLEAQHNELRKEVDALQALAETRAKELNDMISVQKIMASDLTAAHGESQRLKEALCVASAHLQERIDELRQEEKRSLRLEAQHKELRNTEVALQALVDTRSAELRSERERSTALMAELRVRYDLMVEVQYALSEIQVATGLCDR